MLSKLIKGVNWRLLTFLISGEASLSDIARKTKTTKANTFYSLKELESFDVVRKTVRGRTHVYKFNFLHPQAEHILGIAMRERQIEYNERLRNLPSILHAFLSNSVKTNYEGCIFFGSSTVENTYNDIDVFIVLKTMKNAKEIEKKIKLIDKRISPIVGIEKELETGSRNQDMLYKNILEGISFGIDITKLKHRDVFLRKEDIKERFIMGYREVLSCLEFTEKEYQKIHLEKGVMDFIYAILNYSDIFPKNDKEAIVLFKNKFKVQLPKSAKTTIDLMKKYAWIL